MIIDTNVSECDETFIENIDDIIEDTMVQMFVLHPKDEDSLKKVQNLAKEINSILYTLPVKLLDKADSKCIGVYAYASDELKGLEDHIIFVDENKLNDNFCNELKNYKGFILNATKSYDNLENFLISIGPDYVEKFDKEKLKTIPLDKIALQSDYPRCDFNDIYSATEKISEATFRAEQSIAADATKNTMQLLKFKR